MKKLLLLTLLALVGLGAAGLRQRMVDQTDLYAVQTGSMGEASPIGSLVVSRLPTGGVEAGDIVTFGLANGEVITHRVHAVDGDRISTKGDTNQLPDPWTISPDQVRGVATQVVPNAGYALVYLTLPAGIASLFAGLLTLVLAWRLCFPSDPEPDTAVPAPSGDGPMPRSTTRRLSTTVLLGLALVLLSRTDAGAQPAPDLAWCDGAPSAQDLDGILPGETRHVSVDVCNVGATSGELVVTTSADSPLVSITASTVDGTLPEGGRRTLSIEVTLESSAGNEAANQPFQIDLMGTLTDDGVEVSGAVVTRDRGGATLPLTGLAVSTLVLLAAVLLCLGRLGVEWRGRAAHRG